MRRAKAIAWTVGLLLVFGTMTLWVRERWAVGLFQAGTYVAATVWLVSQLTRPVRIVWHPLLAPLAFVPVWGLIQIAAGWSIYPWETLNHVLIWFTHLVLAFLVLQAAQDKRVQEGLRSAAIWFALIVAVQATLQVFTSGGKVFWLYDSGFTHEVLGPFVSRNTYAQFIELFLPLAVWLAIADRRRTPLWIVVAAILFGSVLTGASRAGFAILILEVVAVLFFCWLQKRMPGRAFTFICCQVALLFFVWAAVVGWDYILQRLLGEDPLSDTRWPLIKISWKMVSLHPWTGTGLGTWAIDYPKRAEFDFGSFMNQAHSDWSQWACEGGIPLFVAMLSFLFLIARPVYRSGWGIGIFAVMLHAIVDFPMQQRPAFASLIIVWAAIATLQPHSPGKINSPATFANQ